MSGQYTNSLKLCMFWGETRFGAGRQIVNISFVQLTSKDVTSKEGWKKVTITMVHEKLRNIFSLQIFSLFLENITFHKAVLSFLQTYCFGNVAKGVKSYFLSRRWWPVHIDQHMVYPQPQNQNKFSWVKPLHHKNHSLLVLPIPLQTITTKHLHWSTNKVRTQLIKKTTK